MLETLKYIVETPLAFFIVSFWIVLMWPLFGKINVTIGGKEKDK